MKQKEKKLIIVGAGGHARVVIDAAENSGLRINGIIDINYKDQNESVLKYPVLGDFSVLNQFDPKEKVIIVAIGDEHKRADYFYRIEKLGFDIATIIHPTATISKHATLGKGVFINTGVIINAKAVIGDNAIINTGAIVDHEVIIGKHSQVGPGAKIGGRVSIGDFTFIGIGACVIDKIKIGNNAVIGAGSVIVKDVESDSTVVGIPGKRIKWSTSPRHA
jgi:sugar O-acyltransferase (sialic acid O-acetyltransferase NeuD family)